MKDGTFLAQRINQGLNGKRRGVSHLVGQKKGQIFRFAQTHTNLLAARLWSAKKCHSHQSRD